MKSKRIIITSIAAFLGLFLLIIDTKTAISGATKGIMQCIKVIVPSLFPFFLVSGLFSQCMQQLKLPILSPISKLCHIPKGAEPLFVIGLLGGYPVGAREISVAYTAGHLRRTDAQRMLGFCNNAGPSFIFGIVAMQFTNKFVGLSLFLIQIISAMLTAMILPGKDENIAKTSVKEPDFMSVFHSSIRSITYVCGWVVVFCIILSFMQRWFFWAIPGYFSVVIAGMLELANGSLQLCDIENSGLRLILASAFLSMGGLCVYLQTLSVTKNLGGGMYFPGKLIQCSISVLLSGIAQYLLFNTSDTVPLVYLLLPVLLILTAAYIVRFFPFSKKSVAIHA